MALRENTILLQELLNIATSLPPATSAPDFTTEEKTVTPTKSTQYITPTTASALSKVTVNPIPTEYIIPSGNKELTPSETAQSNIDVKNFETASVSAIPVETKAAVTPTKSSQTVNATSGKYLKTVTVNPIPSEYIIPSGKTEIVNNGTDIDIRQFATVDVNVPIPTFSTEEKTVFPSEDSQVVTPDSTDGLSKVTVGAIPVTYVGSAVPKKSSTDLSVSGATVTVPSGYYASQATKSVASGSAGTPTASKGSVSNHQITITPTVTNTTGYITGGTKTGAGVTVSAADLVSGSQTVVDNGSVNVTNLAELIVNIPFITIRKYSSIPSDSVGEEGDICVVKA